MAGMTARGYFPICELSSYHQRWVIRARIVSKGHLRSFTTKKSTGLQVFECNLLDETGEIKAAFFGPMCEKYYGLLEESKVYTFARGHCRIANRQYNRCNHNYELVFDRDGMIELVADCEHIAMVKFNFVDLRTLQSCTVPCRIDLCVLVVGVAELVIFMTKDGKELVKRELIVADDTAMSMTLAIWGDRAKEEDQRLAKHPVVCFKGVSIKEYRGGRTGSLEQSGSMLFDVKLPDADRVRSWWSMHGEKASLTSLSLANEGISDLQFVQARPLPCTVDLCGVVTNFRAPFAFTSQSGKELVKREIVVADHSGLSVQVTLWGDRAQQNDKLFDGGALILLRGVLVKEWNGGRSGSLLEAGTMTISPSIPEAEKVRLWWSQGGARQDLTCLSQQIPGGGAGAMRVATGRMSTVVEMRRSAELVTSEPEVFSLVTRLALVQTKKQGETQPLIYLACQEPRQGSNLACNKRVGMDGMCPACNRVGKAAPRLNIRCRFSDYTDSVWLTTFNEPAQSLLGSTASAAQELEAGQGGREKLEALLRRQYFQQPLQVTVRAKLDTYLGEPRTNITCIDARPVNRGQHGRLMLKGIRDLLTK